MGKTPSELYKLLTEKVKNDPKIFGLFVHGSRGKGVITKYSDYDISIVVKDTALASYKKQFRGFGGHNFDLFVLTMKQLEKDAAWGSPTAWNRYNFAHLKVQVDKTGKIQKLINIKALVPQNKRKDFISGALDHYINQVFRFVKNLRDGKVNAARFEAAESIAPLLDAVFALEYRIKPYYKYLDWELTKYPLKKLPLQKEGFLKTLIFISKTADLKIQQKLLRSVEKIFRKEGFGKVFDKWEEMLPWMENFKLP
jgi:hypothetical protein